MNSRKNRVIAGILCVVMAMALVVPAGAAVPMMGRDAAVVETPVGEGVQAHTHGTVVERPAVDSRSEQADLLADTELHEHDFKDGLTDDTGFFTIKGNMKSGVASLTMNGKTYSAAMKIESAKKTTLTFTGEGTLTMIVDVASGSVYVDGTLCTASGNVITVELKSGSHSVTKKDELNLYYISLDAVPAHKHVLDAGTVTKEATCTEDGVKTYHCSAAECPANGTVTEAIPALGHDWDEGTVTREPTCTEAGVKTFTCKRTGCSGTRTEAVDPAHKYGVDGVCTVCGEHEHKWDSGEITTQPTCGEEGEKTLHCTVSGCTETDVVVIPATGEHQFENGVCKVCGARETTGFISAAGDLESAYALWPVGAKGTTYTAKVVDASGTKRDVDKELIREYPNYMRVDVLGLKAGTYTIEVTDSTGKTITTDPLKVLAHDRSGYAFNGITTPGAYKADGTLKDGALVLYVTEENKDTVAITVEIENGKPATLTGISEIVTAYKKPKNNAPAIDIRIIGNITDPAGMPNGDLYLDGPKTDSAVAGLTIEGVGSDATCNGFGIVVKNMSYVEIRNLGLMNCNSGEGDDIGLQQGNSHIWVHNCDFFYGDAGSDSDQAKGDGALDTKGSYDVTHSYNHFWDNGKCNLQGNGEDGDRITYHHNWYDHSDSRHPRVRKATVHAYNNYYDGNAKYGVGATQGCSIFVESNYFRNCNDPILISKQGTDAKGSGTFSGDPGGMVKAYGNVFVGAKNLITSKDDPTDFDCYVVDSRNETVPTSVKTVAGGTSYSNFDTASDFYSYKPDTAEDAMVNVTRWAGRVGGGDFQYDFNDATEDTNYAVIQELKTALVNYESKLLSVGGTVTQTVSSGSGSTECQHDITGAAWKVITPGTCDPQTQELVSGQEGIYCIICNELVDTRTLPGAHSNQGANECTVCGKAVSNNEGPTINPNSKILKYNDFTSGNPEDPITQAQLDEKYDGYFQLVGTGVQRRASGTKGIDFIHLPSSGSSGIKFTVERGPADVYITASSAGKNKTSLMNLKDANGNAVANVKGESVVTLKDSVDSATTVQYALAAGTYTLTAASGSAQPVRLRQLSVTEPEAPCEHTSSIHHDAVAATCKRDGNIEYWTCTDTCKKNFSDEAMTKVVTNVTVEATGKHTWGEWSEPDEDGEQIRVCSVCQSVETRGGDDETDPGDTEETWKVTLNLTYLQCTDAPETVEKNGRLTLLLAIKTSSYNLPTSVAVRMGGVTLAANQYSYNANSGELVIETVTGDVVITAAGRFSGSGEGGNQGGGSTGGSSGGGGAAPVTTVKALPFLDVEQEDWYYDTVKKAYDLGLMNGTDATHFTPGQNTSRAMIATILFRLDGEKETNVEAAFNDVADGEWYSEAVEWAAAAGIVKGYSDDVFAPDDNITREQLAVMLFRYANPSMMDKSDALRGFVDVESVSDWATDAMQWAVKTGIITGKGANNLDPQGLATRAEAVTMLMRYVELQK